MKKAKGSSRERLLEATEQLLREVGMAGAGIKDVAARSGAPIGSVYFHFPAGKAQLVTESLEIHAEKSRRLLATVFDGKRPAAAALGMLFETAAKGFERAGGDKACAIGTVTLDVTEADQAIRRLCSATFESWVDLIAPHLPWPDARSRRSFALTVVAALEGGFILGKASRSGDPFRAAGKWLAATAASNESSRTRRRPEARKGKAGSAAKGAARSRRSRS